MDSTNEEHIIRELSKNSNKSFDYLHKAFEDMNECLSNDETFFNKEIEATMYYVKTIEIKFRERIQEFRSQLEKINEENIKTSKSNREQFEKETEKINSLFDSGILYEALKKCTEYEKQFVQRKTVINDIPKLHMNEQMIEQLFSPENQNQNRSVPSATNQRLIEQRTNVIPDMPSSIFDDDRQDNSQRTAKQRLRGEKVIESMTVNKEDEEMVNDKNDHEYDNSKFGIRSKPRENHQSATVPIRTITPTTPVINTTTTATRTTVPVRTVIPTAPVTNTTTTAARSTVPVRTITPTAPVTNTSTTVTPVDNMKNDTKSPTTNPTSQSMFRFSTRLGPSSSNTNTSVFHRNISTPPTIQNTNVISHNNQEQVRLTPPTPPNSVRFLTEQPTTSDEDSPFKILKSIPVLEYYIEPNYHLLMTCNAEYIVLYKSQITRLDRWRLDAIQRGSHNSCILDWHDGLIISMGLIEKNTIYMFTEHEFFMYSITSGRKIDARMLPRGTDDGSNINSVPYNNSQRGIGAVYGDFMYHIYLNHHSQWTLSKTILDKLARTPSYNLTTIFPDVERFIHFCVNAKTINFLVQMNDSSYAVVFCSVKNCNSNEYRSTVVTLLHAQQPLTICSAFIRCQDKYIFYINDPSIDILHAIDIENYLYASQILAHAICYEENKEELMVVTNNSICSINVNEENSILKNFR
ncbi:unnamed protein product [Adineta steineri]|uniref:Uncharacterized protein n=1 Tax=Adineta steineri TaxID=433720 RepID=A0A814N1F7_9BILA|nr:unnamed protein product [Adineta steineri]CAF1144369.1 unnamed protein product [Adineta steineri]